MKKLILFLSLTMVMACGDDDDDSTPTNGAVDQVIIPDVEYEQIDRTAIPGVSTGLLVGDAEKEAYNMATPSGDFAAFGPTALDRAIAIQSEVIPALGLPAAADASVLQQVYANGDVLYIDPAISGYDPVVLTDPNAILANGRLPGTDVMDLVLSVVAANTVSYDIIEDGVPENDVPIPSEFPYLAAPH